MRSWLNGLLGVDTSDIPDDATLQLEWQNLPQSWEVFVLIGVVLLLTWLVWRWYKSEKGPCSLLTRRMLTLLRFAALGLLLLVFLDPVLRYTRERSLRPTVLMLRDASLSMNTKDAYHNDADARRVAEALQTDPATVRERKPSRTDLINHLLRADEGRLVQQLAAKGTLRLQDFGDRVRTIELPPDQPLPPELQADGVATDLTKAIEEGLADKMAAGMVILTDGQHNSPNDLRTVATEARDKGVPLFIVGVGDPDKPRNLAVNDLYADSQVWADDPFEIQATLQAQGTANETVTARLIELVSAEDGTEPEEVERATTEVKLPENGQQRIRFLFRPQEHGRRYFTVKVDHLTPERTYEDNVADTPIEVQVLDEKARVLLISGSPSWEYRSVTKLLTLDKSIDLSCWLQTMDRQREGEGNTPISALPATREELFQFDVVIMMDPDPEEFDGPWVDLLKQFVQEHSGGLFFMAGPLQSARFIGRSGTSKIQELLPVTFGDLGRIEVASMLATNNRDWPLGVVTANADQAIMRMHADPMRNLDIWQKLPGIYWSFPAELAKPSARVLLQHTDPTYIIGESSRPLLVTGHYGSGRVVYQGFIGTWLWRQAGANNEYFNRYWVQTTRYLVEGRSLAGKRRGILETDRFHYQIGDRVRVVARQVRDQQFQLLEQKELKAEIEIGTSAITDLLLQAVDNQPGQYEGSFVIREAGPHNLALDLDDGVITLEASINATLPNLESRTTWLNRPLLKQIAEASGGRYFDLNQIGDLAEAIPDRTQQISLQSKPIKVWDTNRLLLLLVGLLGVEWAVRKRTKLL